MAGVSEFELYYPVRRITAGPIDWLYTPLGGVLGYRDAAHVCELIPRVLRYDGLRVKIRTGGEMWWEFTTGFEDGNLKPVLTGGGGGGVGYAKLNEPNLFTQQNTFAAVDGEGSGAILNRVDIDGNSVAFGQEMPTMWYLRKSGDDFEISYSTSETGTPTLLIPNGDLANDSSAVNVFTLKEYVASVMSSTPGGGGGDTITGITFERNLLRVNTDKGNSSVDLSSFGKPIYVVDVDSTGANSFVASFLSPNFRDNVFLTVGRSAGNNGQSGLIGFSQENGVPAMFVTNYGRPASDFKILGSNGNIGVGINMPTERVHVDGKVKAIGFLGTSFAAPSGDGYTEYFGNGHITYNKDYHSYVENQPYYIYCRDRDVTIGRGQYPTITPTATFKNNGRVGINIVEPTEQLEVSGNVKATKFIGDGSQLTGISSVVVEQNLSSYSDTAVPSVAAVRDSFINNLTANTRTVGALDAKQGPIIKGLFDDLDNRKSTITVINDSFAYFTVTQNQYYAVGDILYKRTGATALQQANSDIYEGANGWAYVLGVRLYDGFTATGNHGYRNDSQWVKYRVGITDQRAYNGQIWYNDGKAYRNINPNGINFPQLISSAAEFANDKAKWENILYPTSTFTPKTVKDLVTATSNTWANGELQGDKPNGSVPDMKFCDANYRYEYMLGMNDTDGTTYVWVRLLKSM
jgi:hypothetical protein